MLNVINNPLSYFAGAVFGATLNLDFWCAYIGIKRGIDSFADQGSFLLKSEVLQQHGTRENLCQRVGEVLTCCLRP